MTNNHDTKKGSRASSASSNKVGSAIGGEAIKEDDIGGGILTPRQPMQLKLRGELSA